MRRLLFLFVALLFAVTLNAQDSSFIRYYPAPVAGTSGGGATFTAPVLLPDGTAAAPSLAFASDLDTGFFRFASTYFTFAFGGAQVLQFPTNASDSGLTIDDTAGYKWSTSVGAAGYDLALYRDAANTLALRNGGTAGTPVPQTFNVYNFCDGVGCATGYERFSAYFAANILNITTQAAGTGTVRAMRIGPALTWWFGGSGNIYPTSADTYSFGQAGSEANHLYLSRSIQGSKSKTLTDAAAAVSFVRIAVPTNGYIGGKVIATANSTDGTNRLTTTSEWYFAGADTAGTVTCGAPSAVGTPATAYRRGNTLVCTLTSVTSTTNCDLQVTCTDNLVGDQTPIFEWRLDMPSPATVTPQ